MRGATAWVQPFAQLPWFARHATTQPRLFHNSNCAHRTTISIHISNDSRRSSVTRAKRTKRVLSELPQRFTAADGTLASPLEPWPGGLSGSTSSTVAHLKELEEAPAPASEGEMSENSDLSSMKKRRINRAKTSGRRKNASGSSQPDTPLAKEILDNLGRFPHCILLTRVGQFYESYFSQAEEVAQLLSIKLASKSWGGGRVPMCGFPIMHLNKYLKVLVQDNRRFVALCEEFPRSPSLDSKDGFYRRVTRIVTPGTLIDEPFLNPYENNYLLAIDCLPGNLVKDDDSDYLGLAWMDVSTGDFFAKSISCNALRDELARISPREVVLHKGLKDSSHVLLQTAVDEGLFVSFIEPPTSSSDVPVMGVHVGMDDLTSQTQETHETSVSLALTDRELRAVNLLTAFLKENLLGNAPQLSSPSREAIAQRMQIDSHTMKALELKETIREGGTAGSLLSVIKRTVTSGGTRLLSRWICSPSASVTEIVARQSLVAFFHSRPHLRADMVRSLGQLEDTTRILQKFVLGRGDPSDLAAICDTIAVWTSVKKTLEFERQIELRERGDLNPADWTSMETLLDRLHDLHDLASRIEAALASRDPQDEVDHQSEETSVKLSSMSSSSAKTIPIMFNWAVRPDFSDELTTLHKKLNKYLRSKYTLELRLQQDYACPSLTLRSSPGYGMHVHIGRKRDARNVKADDSFIPISESGTTLTFFYKEWSQLGSKIVELAGLISAAERVAFEVLRQNVKVHATEIRQNSRIMDELDVSIAYANLASELNLVRPTVVEDMSYHVVNGRHPTVELGLLSAGRVFNANTVSFTEDSPFHVITGPNMAGKSTLLRQTALIAILAQTGSFVPADSARIGIIDKIFSRVGAKDDLFRNKSTFMVEMLETADILRRATSNSLVIMDEVGRGTTVEDGLAIAFATVHHLLSQNRCRTLFATHFHELADLLGCTSDYQGSGAFAGVSFYCTNVDETEDGYFTYSHRLKPGVNRDSHGLRVAQLAGMPESAVGIARAALDWLRQRRDATTRHNKTPLQSLGKNLAEGRLS